MKNLSKIYTIKTQQIENTPGQWNSTLVEIFCHNKKIGEYKRNYPSFSASTFFPFEYKNKHYALYSKDYTCTRVMTLPDCQDWCGEEKNKFGFCPTEYNVPFHYDMDLYFKNDKEYENKLNDIFNSFEKELTSEEKSQIEHDLFGVYAPFGFVAGCVWGDDSFMKLEVLKFSQLENKILKRDSVFGYFELPNKLNLKQAIDYTYWGQDEGWSFEIARNFSFRSDNKTINFAPQFEQDWKNRKQYLL